MVYQDVMRCKELTPESKAIYAYLASIAGDNDECYPSRELMSKELGMSLNRLDKHLSMLVANGVVKKMRMCLGNLKGKNIYKITHEMQVKEELEEIFRNIENKGIENKGIEFRGVENECTNNNSLNNNSLNNNNNINYQLIADMYNNTCVSFPRLTKLSDARKKAIKARLKTYTLDDFRKLFELAESSSFLKGQNNSNWSATFDWLIKDANMAKVLDGNYSDSSSSYRNVVLQPEEQPKVNAYQERMEKMLGENYERTEGPFF